jgi:hypothetical protein
VPQPLERIHDESEKFGRAGLSMHIADAEIRALLARIGMGGGADGRHAMEAELPGCAEVLLETPEDAG